MRSRPSLHLLADDFSDKLRSDEEQEPVMTPESSPEDEAQAKTNPDELITESRYLHLLVDEAITSLLRLSVQIHKSSRKAKFAKSSVDKRYATGPDINHARDFFPHLDTSGNVALAEMLGQANAQRRQWLWYRRRHRQKLSMDLSGAASGGMPPFGEWSARHGAQGEDADTETIALFSVDEEGPSAIWTPSLVSGTKASTFRSRPTAVICSLLSQSNAPPETFIKGSRQRGEVVGTTTALRSGFKQHRVGIPV